MISENLVSVIIPVYKVEKYIDKCISSVINQTYKNIEIILVDDGSPDNCPAICDDYANKDCRVRVIHKENGGLSSARNAGISEAHGEFISFVDSDDYVHPQMIEKMLDALLINSADLCICGMRWVNEDGSGFPNVAPSPIKNEIFDSRGINNVLIEPAYFYYVTSVNKLYKKQIFDNISFPIGKRNEDEFTIHHIFDKCSKVVCIEDELYFYVQRDNSIMHSPFSVKKLDAVDAFIDRAKFFKKKKIKQNAKYATLQAYSTLLCYIKQGDAYKNRKEFRTYVWRVSKLLKFNLRNAKLLLNFYLRLVKGSITYQKFKTYLAFNLKNKNHGRIVLMATPVHGNLGDQAIVFSEYKLLNEICPKKKIVEIPNNSYLRFPELCRKYIRKNDVIIIDGGGNLGSLWKNEDDKISSIVSDYKENKIIIFPQTCFYDEEKDKNRILKNSKIYSEASDLSVMLRDKRSLDQFEKLFPEVSAYYVPDVVLSLHPTLKNKKRDGVILCFREDVEKDILNEDKTRLEEYLKENGISFRYSSTLVSKRVVKRNRKEELQHKWEEFSSAELIITDRLHAMIFSAITETPCIAIDNISKKVSGTYEWINDLDYVVCVRSIEEALLKLPEMQKKNLCKYSFKYPVEHIRGIMNGIC